jgi:O-antigen/teichoic acid export membrane protein
MSDERAITAGHRKSVARNTIWNLAGQALPMLVAVVSIPFLISGLGPERFGFLAIAWVVVGYFGLFDFGLGQAVTRSLAAILARGAVSEAPRLVWNAILANVALGISGGTLLALVGPWLAEHALQLPSAIRAEGVAAFYVLAASVPFVVLSSALRGALEAAGRFDLVNLVKIPVSMVNYAAPLGVLLFTTHLGVVVLVIALGRVAASVAYWYLMVSRLAFIRGAWTPSIQPIRPLIRFGGWLTVTNILVPVIVSVDRFIISAAVSIGAVAYYAAPYEVITKLWVFSGALLGVLFPIFSSFGDAPERRIAALADRAVLLLTAVTLPIVAIALGFAHELLALWLGSEFASQGSSVARWLAVGVFVNVLAQVPLTAIHGLGRADITAKLLGLELFGYVALAWALAERFGIEGVAFAWAVRALADAAVLFVLLAQLAPRPADAGVNWSKILPAAAFLAFFGGIGIAGKWDLGARLGAVGLGFAALCYWLWAHLLTADDRRWMRQLVNRMF